MKHGRWIVVAGCLGMTGALLAGLMATFRDSRRHDPRMLSHLAALEQRVADLERDPPSRAVGQPLITEVDPPLLARESQGADEGPAVRDGGEPKEGTNVPLFARLSPSEQLTAYESEFSRRPSTRSTWANEKEKDLAETWRQSPSLVRIDCRADVCRVETEDTSGAEAEAFLDAQAFSPGLLGTSYHRYSLDDSGKRFVMFVRPGGVRNPPGYD